MLTTGQLDANIRATLLRNKCMPRHKRVYRATNPIVHWTCGTCSQKFSRRYSLLIHVARIHDAPYTLLDLNTKVGQPDWGRGHSEITEEDE
jgi:hypothetical protein